MTIQLNPASLAHALGGVAHGDKISAPGPGHSADDRSMTVWIKPDGEFTVHSHAGDDPIVCRDHVRQKAGLPAFEPKRKVPRATFDIQAALMAAVAAQGQDAAAPPKKARIIATYEYRDANGELLYQVCRLEPKSFRQRRPDGNDGWVWDVGEKRVPYRLGELLKYPYATVFVCEGEKDADRVAELGHCATTAASGRWTADCVQALAGRDVFIMEDNDDAGREKAAAAVARVLHGVAKTIRIVQLPDLPPKGDVSDWLDADQRNAERLAEVCLAVPFWTPTAETADAKKESADAGQIPDLGEWDAGDDIDLPPPRHWLLANQFCRKFLSGLLAPGATGKTALRTLQALSLATGRDLCGQHVFKRCKVLMVSLEDDQDEMKRRIAAACIHHGIDRADLKGWLFLAAPKGFKLAEVNNKGARQIGILEKMLRKTIEARKPDIVMLDPFIKLHALEENDNGAMDFVCDLLVQLAIEYDIAVDAPHHTKKGQLVAGDADAGRGASAARDAGRLIYTLTRMSEDEAKAFGVKVEDRPRYVRLDSGKVNTAPPSGEATWFKLIGVPLGNGNAEYPNGDEVQTLVRWHPPQTWDGLSSVQLNAALTEIDAGLPNGQRCSNDGNATDRAAWPIIQRHCPDRTEHQCREIIKVWIKSGLLIKERYEDPVVRKACNGLRVDHSKRPQ
jgi:hypothetical protein